MKVLFQSIFALLICLLAFNCGTDETPEDPPKPVLSISDLAVPEGNENNNIQLTVSLSAASTTNVIVSYATVEGTATAGLDFFSTDGDLTFAAGETQKNISIELKGDEFEENNEQFELIILNPINATLGNSRATITIENDDNVQGGLVIPNTGFTTPTSYPGYALVWSDEFQGSTLNMSDWTHEIGGGGWGNNELEYYQPDNTYMAESEYMIIEAREESVSGLNYTSSRAITQGKQEFQYGRIDIRAVLPEGQGIWPALWMLGSNFGSIGWPDCGEIDIMELVGHLPGQVHGTVHMGADPSQHHFIGSSVILPGNAKFSEEFHVYSILWEENNIKFLLDDEQFFEFTPAQTNGQPYPFNQPFFFIFNVAVGGQWPGSPDETTVFPQRMIVDYVRVFQ